MIEKLEEVYKKHLEINEKLSNPNIFSDNEQYRKLMRQSKSLGPLVEKYGEYRKAVGDMSESEELLKDDEIDEEFKEMLLAEVRLIEERIDLLKDELKVLLLPRDEDDDRNVIIEIRGGAGGDEAALFANSLFRMYSMYADGKR